MKFLEFFTEAAIHRPRPHFASYWPQLPIPNGKPSCALLDRQRHLNSSNIPSYRVAGALFRGSAHFVSA